MNEWLTIQGAVVSVDANTLVVQTSSGDQVTRVGFYEGDDPSMSSGHGFEVGRISDAINGQTVLVRDENGRPLWAGRGRRGG